MISPSHDYVREVMCGARNWILIRPIERVVLAGARPLATATLTMLTRLCRETGRHVVGVLTDQSERARGWWSDEGVAEVGELAATLGLRLLRDEDLGSIDYDLLLSVYWGRIFAPQTLARAALNVNLHTAPLPEYRGRYSCSMALLNDDTQFGPTLHVMEPAVDCGPVIAAARFPVAAADTARTLYDRANAVSLDLLRDWLPRVLEGSFQVVEQSAIARRTGRPVRYYPADALQAYTARVPRLTPHEIDLRRRALTFPPRYYPPDWLAALPDAGQEWGETPQ